jgi:hypothetical protein
MGKRKMSEWNRFLKQEHAEMKRSNPDVSLGQAMKSASPKWKKMNKTQKNRMQGGSGLSMSSLDGAPADVEVGSKFAGGRRRRKSRGTRGTRKRR